MYLVVDHKIAWTDYYSLSFAVWIFCISFSPSQPVKEDERPLESGYALGFFPEGSFSWPWLHLACSGGYSLFSADCEKVL